MGSAPQSIQSLLHIATPEITDVLGRARFLARIRAALVEVLPEAATPHVQVAGYDDFTLSLHAANAAWATRLRYMEPVLCRALAQRLRLQVDRVQVRVRPVHLGPFSTPRRPRPLSAASRRHIAQTARFIEDPGLAEALRRLAAAGHDAP